jgi:enoyl-CoA hydratase/carnithine racemase
MNSISRLMLDQLAACLLRAEGDPEVRVVLLTGQGSSFCVGLDLVSAGDDGDIGPNAAMSPSIDLRNAPSTILFNMDKPTICALNGSAAGYGMDLALGRDIRIISDAAKMVAAFTKRDIKLRQSQSWTLFHTQVLTVPLGQGVRRQFSA